MLKYFQNKFKMFFDPENMEKTPSKVAHNRPPLFFSALPKTAGLPRQLKTHTAFSMFPILDTNLW
jgi:hypothetical protein